MPILFLIVLFAAFSANVYALTIEPGAKVVEVTVETKFSELLNKVGAVGFDKDSLSCPGVRKEELLKARIKDLSIGDLNIAVNAQCSARPIAPVDPGKLAQEKYEEEKLALANASYTDEDDVKAIQSILKKYKEQSAAMNFISSCKSPVEGNKHVLYLAARKGNIATLRMIKEILGDENFLKLLREKTNQDQSVLHAAARAVKNAKEVIDFIVSLAPELVHQRNQAHCTPYDVAIMFDAVDDDRLAALLNDKPDSRTYRARKKEVSDDCKPIQKGGI